MSDSSSSNSGCGNNNKTSTLATTTATATTTTTTTTSSSPPPPIPATDLFKYYMEKCYVLPLELKNDIIYCQRAMRDFLKVHGLVSDVFKEQADADPVQMQRILDELEEEVFEINAEQQYLLLRLNDNLDVFYKKLQENNIPSVPEVGNECVSSQIVPLISDASYKIYPQSVLTRDNEEMLIRKHFLLSQDEEAGVPPLKLSDLDENIPLMLAPPKQRQPPNEKDDCRSQLMIPRSEERKLNSSPPPLAPITAKSNSTAVPAPTTAAAAAPIDFEVVAQSRMNLRKALKRARKTKQQPRMCDEEDLELTAVEHSKKLKSSTGLTFKKAKPPTPPPPPAPASPASTPATAAATTSAANASKPTKTRTVRRKSSPLPASGGGSSDDSNQEQQWRLDEPRETRTQPEEYGQAPFLELFGLYTHEAVKKLNQRHSKRKRRTVQNASGVDFHYGQQLNAMDAIAARHKKLKNKPEFLLSPKEKRLQAKKEQTKVNQGNAAVPVAAKEQRKSKTPDKAETNTKADSLTSQEKRAIKLKKFPKCKECKKRAAREQQLFCHFCGCHYHHECHVFTKSKLHTQYQYTRCPPCLREQVART